MPQTRQLCIHGHFYQPPREDPWLGRILIEQSAAPMRHWNERIVAESYGPMGWAHRIGEDGKIIEIINCYEWISFNAGPTLMGWLERKAPEVYARILEADAASVKRWGHGNAIAQIYHHVIMPLASDLDRELETAWAIQDFTARFGRKPEGMWLSECAADEKSLETLAAAGISFVILSPHQAKEIIDRDGRVQPVSGGNFDITKPYRIALPSGASIAVFFYDGPVSQAVAFEGLLQNGEQFWTRVNNAATGGLLTLATDGETYGHHFPFGEMALAYLLAQGRDGRDGLALTNPAAYLAANAPDSTVRLHNPSSWSCAHGVERWRSNCGCKDGGHPDWNQRWRGPLREALDKVKSALDAHFFATGKACFKDPNAALLAYGSVLANRDNAASFAAEHFLAPEKADTAWQLLAMQEQALAAYASCAWFFDDISRIEPVNGMTFMVRAMELAVRSGGPDMLDAFRKKLAEAVSNKEEEGTGADILEHRVLPRRQDTASLALMVLCLLDAEKRLPEPGTTLGEDVTVAWPAFSASVRVEKAWEEGGVRHYSGSLHIGTALEQQGESATWAWVAPSREGVEDLNRFVSLRDSSITVTDARGVAVSRCVADLARHVRDYITLVGVMARREQDDVSLAAKGRNILSMTMPWEEGQATVAYEWLWAPFAPYVLQACVLDNSMADVRVQQVLEFLEKLEIPYFMREDGWKMVERRMLAELAAPSPDWELLAVWVRRAAPVFPERNLWAVRNAFWQKGMDVPEAAGLRAALGFR